MAKLMEAFLRRDRLIVAGGLVLVAGLAWIYLVRAGAAMSSMAAMDREMAAMGMADTHLWGAGDWFALFVMWAVMMAGMMLPSAAPVILLVLGAYRRRSDARARWSALAFGAGYLAAWGGFSAIAAAVQVVLHRAAMLDSGMASRSSLFGGVVLLAAGIYQWVPLKNACLAHCRSPLGFLMTSWREGIAGGAVMGAKHGLFCIGCCGALMALLFVVGVMNILWVAAIAAFVLLEKLLPPRFAVSKIAGLLLITWGLVTLTRFQGF